MKSLILTALYLAKDTLNRWVSRISSPLARVLVVFFLSLCALCFMGSYVITAKALRDKIRTQGGDLVQMMIFSSPGGNATALPTEQELSDLLDVDSLAVRSVGSAMVDQRNVSIFTYDFQRSSQFVPLLSPSAGPCLLCPMDKPVFRPGPKDVRLAGDSTSRTLLVRHLPPDHLLMRLMPEGCILIPPEMAEGLSSNRGGSMQRIITRVRNLVGAKSLTRIETYFENMLRLEGAQGHVISASRMLKEMDVVLSNQTQCRAAFCIGIVSIVGILLTALAGMEYRQNEYIYTLMKSFGIHPAMLIGAFLVENLLLVGLSFAGAVVAFMKSQEIIVSQFFKMGHYSLKLEEIMPEIQLIAAMLLICIAVSSIPIIAAANREIGRVLK